MSRMSSFRTKVRLCTIRWGFYLFDSSGQVFDKKPPEVVERLQLSGLCDSKNPVRKNYTQT